MSISNVKIKKALEKLSERILELNKENYLGDLEELSGQEIFFKKKFIINYYFWRNNFILIRPKMNGYLVGNKKKINLNDLIIKGVLNIVFEGIGT